MATIANLGIQLYEEKNNKNRLTLDPIISANVIRDSYIILDMYSLYTAYCGIHQRLDMKGCKC